MAVYTHLGAEDLAELIAAYDVGELVSAKGIAEGVSNSNWLIETTRARYILTMYELRIDTAHLPFFLGLLDHLSAKGCPVPRTIHDCDGAAFRMIEDKAVALIEFLPGVSVDHPTPGQAKAVGSALAQLHHAVADFPMQGIQTMGLAEWDRLIHQCGSERLDTISPGLSDLAYEELSYLAMHWPGGLPHGVVHCDLFPDNVLMLGDRVSGLIDFYFSADDFFAYDLAVTHAAWCFSPGGHQFRPEISSALLAGYASGRALSDEERDQMPVLLRGACMRFLSSRAYDWVFTPTDALVVRKDPMDFARRLDFYRANGKELFA
ncbi:homoserine kinase [Erythrobacter mangrovi]|uniref:Homoserine kinase n=1 Tax=Erythrobacter mangrovi TaxID=2739433 RepID=A0A7D3XN98_9SPHN|nr:homoserine kinase [Erythrobacter mangrovi]QKG70174.1 homoserine kinase [Erythrobacter mangrovi]